MRCGRVQQLQILFILNFVAKILSESAGICKRWGVLRTKASQDQNSTKIGWKSFEDLVGRLEIMLGSGVAKVKINDQLRDNTGKLRQVDASVRLFTGTTELLYIIECRKRHRVSDVTWVEQVSTKRRRLGAHKAILVSNRPLSRNALAAAISEGIDVRTLEDVEECFMGDNELPKLRMMEITWSPYAQLQVLVANSGELTACEQEALQQALSGPSQDVMISLPERTSSLTLDQLVSEVRQNLVNVSFPPGEAGGYAVTEVICPGALGKLKFGDHELKLHGLRVIFEGAVEVHEPDDYYVGQYMHPAGAIDHLVGAAAFQRKEEVLTFTAAVQRDKKRFLVNVPYSFGNEEFRASMDKESGATFEVAFDEKDQAFVNRLDYKR